MKQEKSDAHLSAHNSFCGEEGMSAANAFDAEAIGHLLREALDDLGTQHSSSNSAQRGPESVTCSSTSTSLRNPPKVETLPQRQLRLMVELEMGNQRARQLNDEMSVLLARLTSLQREAAHGKCKIDVSLKTHNTSEPATQYAEGQVQQMSCRALVSGAAVVSHLTTWARSTSAAIARSAAQSQ